jgi:L-malate glycosyltransferase
MMRILFIAPGDNPHTWKWVGWFGQHYPGEIGLIPYQAPVPDGKLPGVEIFKPHIPIFEIKSPRSWFEIKRVYSIVNSIKPKILHVLWAYGAGMYGAKCEYHPFILSPWGSDITVYPNRSGLKGTIQRKIVRDSLLEADYITSTSKFLAAEIQKLDPQHRTPDLLPYGVDTTVFDPDKVKPLEFPWPDGAPKGPGTITLGFFKALEMTYGPDVLVDAVLSARVKIPNLRCVIGGVGPMLEILKKQASRREKHFCFPGRIPFDQMPSALAAIDIFVMPSRNESFGVAALEASAMKKPVIARGKWGIPEVVLDNETGLLVEYRNRPGNLSDEIMRLCNDPDLQARLGENGRQFVQSNFEYSTLMQKADSYYSQIP